MSHSIDIMEARIKLDENGLADCVSVHTLIEVGENEEALDFCNSILRQPIKSLDDLPTRAYLTVLVACISDKVDKDVQLRKARQVWSRIHQHQENAQDAKRGISRRHTEKQWKGVMDELDETEAYFLNEINAAKLPLETKITVLENELLVSESKATHLKNELLVSESKVKLLKRELESKVTHLKNELLVSESKLTLLENELDASKSECTLLEDQSIAKQEKIDILQAEVALLKSQRSSDYAHATTLSNGQAIRPKWTAPWPLSLCLSPGFDNEDSDASTAEKPRPLQHEPSMIFDNNQVRYSTSHQRMTDGKTSISASRAQTFAPAVEESDIDKLMRNGPILIRPGRPLAYVNDAGNIVEVDLGISDLPPMLFTQSGTSPRAATNTSAASARHKSTAY